MSTRESLSVRSRFLEAIGHLAAEGPPGDAISVEAVGHSVGSARDEAIRVAGELMDDGWVTGVPLHGDGRIMTINGLELTGGGRRELSRQRGLLFMLELEREAGGIPDAEADALAIGERLGWT